MTDEWHEKYGCWRALRSGEVFDKAVGNRPKARIYRRSSFSRPLSIGVAWWHHEVQRGSGCIIQLFSISVDSFLCIAASRLYLILLVAVYLLDLFFGEAVDWSSKSAPLSTLIAFHEDRSFFRQK